MALHTIIFDTLISIIPKVIIEQLIFQYITNPFKYKIDTLIPFNNIHHNKQLGIIYCSSQNSYKLIDYQTGKPPNSSNINVKSFEHHFPNNLHKKLYMPIIYFDGNYILTKSRGISQYVFNNDKYTRTHQQNMICGYNNLHVHNQRIYLQSGFSNVYRIEVYDLVQLNYIEQSQYFDIVRSCQYTSQMSVHNDIIYICEHKSGNTYNILFHDIKTLERITYHAFELKHDTMTIYKNMIYTYSQNKVYVYDTKTFNKLYMFDVEPFKDPKPHHITHMSISNGVLMISNNNEVQIYHLE